MTQVNLDSKRTKPSRRFVVAIHGGASNSGRVDKNYKDDAKTALTATIDLALKRLMNGESALQVAEAAVAALEDAPVFNAGKGAAFNASLEHELEAAIVDGSTKRTGAVALTRSTKNPVKAARLVLESGRHTFIAGSAADDFAKAGGLEQVSNSHFDTDHRRVQMSSLPAKQAGDAEFGTVGVIVLDAHGNLAVASSTGGLRGKDSGRIGDTAIPGAGLWADDSSAIVCSGSGDEILRHAVTGKIVGLARHTSLRDAVNTTLAEFTQDTGSVCSILALNKAGQVIVESSSHLFVIATGSGTLGSTETEKEVHFVSNTIPLLPRHVFMRDGRFTAGAYRYPSTAGHAVVVAERDVDISSLDLRDFVNLYQFVRNAGQALASHTRSRRCSMASDGQTIHLIPLHGLSESWNAVIHSVEEYYPTYPGYLTSKNGPKLSNTALDGVKQCLTTVSGLKEPFDKTFLGDASDDNLFARIVRGELEQWRFWENSTHIAFLTPFGNTPGFTVVIPRRHLSSDIFALSDADYEELLNATHTVSGIIKRALGVNRVGVFFEGFEIDYTHSKIIPIYEEGASQAIVPLAEFQTRYPGFITTQPGPQVKDLAVLDAVADGAREYIASQEKLRAPRLWAEGTISRVEKVDSDRWYRGMLAIQDAIFKDTVGYFSGELNYRFALLPVTTGAISSPMGLGSDSVPVPINLFGEKTYLADSMQFYLERMLRLDNGSNGGVYYVAPTFRGEDHDATHLNQFFHVECELVGGINPAITVAEGYVVHIARQLLKHHSPLVSMYAGKTTHIQQVVDLYVNNGDKFPRITLDEALALSFMPENSWEYVVQDRPELGRSLTRKGERALIAHFGGAVWVTEMDHMSVPFYQAYRDEKQTKALCADLLLGLGETLGLGQRHVYADDVEHAILEHHIGKGLETYDWYIELRRHKILQTSGWGLGLERFLAWLLQHDDIRDMPLIPVLKKPSHNC